MLVICPIANICVKLNISVTNLSSGMGLGESKHFCYYTFVCLHGDRWVKENIFVKLAWRCEKLNIYFAKLFVGDVRLMFETLFIYLFFITRARNFGKMPFQMQ